MSTTRSTSSTFSSASSARSELAHDFPPTSAVATDALLLVVDDTEAAEKSAVGVVPPTHQHHQDDNLSRRRMKNCKGSDRPSNNSKKKRSHDTIATTSIIKSALSHQSLPEGYTDQDYSHLAHSFKRPLFNNATSLSSTTTTNTAISPSVPLHIAYTHHTNASNLHKRARQKSNALSKECKLLEEKLQKKQQELSLANEELKRHTQAVGAWTRKVFDLELSEPCEWNMKYGKLKEYTERNHGRLPPPSLLDDTVASNSKDDEEERMLAAWLDGMRSERNHDVKRDFDDDDDDDDEIECTDPVKKKKQTTTGNTKKNNLNNTPLSDYPHRLEALTNLGVTFLTNIIPSINDDNHDKSKNWDIMFQQLVNYKEEHGTLRFPSDEQCAATMNEEFIALQRWVKGQVMMFRYSKKEKKKKKKDWKESESVRRLREIGFDFEKWSAKPGTKKEEEMTKKDGEIEATTLKC